MTLEEIVSGLPVTYKHVRTLLEDKYRCWSEIINTPDDDLGVFWVQW